MSNGDSLTGALLTAVSFATILWQVAGSAKIPWGGGTIEIPGYLAVIAVVWFMRWSSLRIWQRPERIAQAGYASPCRDRTNVQDALQ